MAQPFPHRSGRRAADSLAIAALVLALVCYVAHWVWVWVEYSRFQWTDGAILVAGILMILAPAIWLAASGKQVARVAGGIGAGTVVLEMLSYILNSLSGNISWSSWSAGGWLTIPCMLFVLGAVVALLAASSEAEKGSSPQPPAGPWQPQPPMPGVQPPAGYPGQHQPPPQYQQYHQYQQPPPQWPQQ